MEVPTKRLLEVTGSGPVGVPVVQTASEVAIRQTEALESLATGVNALAEFVTQGGLMNFAKAGVIGGMLQGLTQHDGRGALDARVIKQNAIEITEVIQAVFAKMHERVTAPARDAEIRAAVESAEEGGTRGTGE